MHVGAPRRWVRIPYMFCFSKIFVIFFSYRFSTSTDRVRRLVCNVCRQESSGFFFDNILIRETLCSVYST